MSLCYLSVCSGMEAASVAWEPLGFKAVGFSEIEPFPCAILKHRFPNTPNYGSLTEYQSWPIEKGTVDLLVGGTPCQSFSVAGLRKGLEDPRGNLALTFLGLADKLRPKWIVWENVPGVLSSNGGRDLGSFLGALGQLGYGWAFRILDAQHFGVPQRRRRVFVVATSTGDGRLAGEVLSLPEGLRGYLASRKQKGKGAASDAGTGTEADGRSAGTINCQPDGISGTVTSKWHKGSGGPAGDEHYNMVAEPKSHWDGGPHPTLNQSAKGSGAPGYSNQEIFSQGGGGLVPGQQPIPYRKAKRAQSTTDDESWVEGEVSNTLNNFDLGDTRTTHAVVEPTPFSVAFGGAKLEKIAPTVVSNSGPNRHGEGSWSSTQFTGVVEPIAIQGTIIGRGENAGPQGVGATEGGPMFTLTKTDIHGVAQPIAFTTEQTPKFNHDQALTLTKQSPTGGGQPQCVAQPITFQPGNLRREAGADPSTEATTTLKATPGNQMPHVAYSFDSLASNSMKSSNPISGCREVDLAKTIDTTNPCPSKNQGGIGIVQHMAVRRLTPVECERLQGFPDNWSRIPWKGKPEEDCPDGPRYKACGNSMAVPVMRWIGKRIAEVDAKLSQTK